MDIPLLISSLSAAKTLGGALLDERDRQKAAAIQIQLTEKGPAVGGTRHHHQQRRGASCFERARTRAGESRARTRPLPTCKTWRRWGFLRLSAATDCRTHRARRRASSFPLPAVLRCWQEERLVLERHIRHLSDLQDTDSNHARQAHQLWRGPWVLWVLTSRRLRFDGRSAGLADQLGPVIAPVGSQFLPRYLASRLALDADSQVGCARPELVADVSEVARGCRAPHCKPFGGFRSEPLEVGA